MIFKRRCQIKNIIEKPSNGQSIFSKNNQIIKLSISSQWVLSLPVSMSRRKEKEEGKKDVIQRIEDYTFGQISGIFPFILRKTESFSSLFISLITLNESWSRKKHFLGKKKLALKKRKCFYFNFLQKTIHSFQNFQKTKNKRNPRWNG